MALARSHISSCICISPAASGLSGGEGMGGVRYHGCLSKLNCKGGVKNRKRLNKQTPERPQQHLCKR